MNQTSVLFLCLGNICRSPLAEGVFRAEVTRRGLAGEVRVDSA
ncbi:MAG: phosphotyrosine protein phosphatase, partial [Betaproteobacteria bacterium HGW-Betaproteobacteria-17]